MDLEKADKSGVDMIDKYGRTIEYMRISVTDRCNLRCRYCMPEKIESVPMSDLLTYEEIQTIVKASVSLGIVNYRITGGEPLVRRHIETLVSMIKSVPGVESVTLTTNGVTLAEHTEALKKAGIDRINISLDTINPDMYTYITGSDALENVLAGIDKAIACNIPVKLNAVIKKGSDYYDMLQYAQEKKLILRFIEMMPIGYGRQYASYENDGLFEHLEERYGRGEIIDTENCSFGNGPALYYKFDKLLYPVGFIRALHNKFCNGCNRVRLTSVGSLKTCLCYDEGIELRDMLRGGAGEEDVRQAIEDSIFAKPKEHCFAVPENITEGNSMVKIGG